jgi:hypothetical protein
MHTVKQKLVRAPHRNIRCTPIYSGATVSRPNRIDRLFMPMGFPTLDNFEAGTPRRAKIVIDGHRWPFSEFLLTFPAVLAHLSPILSTLWSRNPLNG